MQEDVARFAADLIRTKAEIMCELYQPQTLVMYSDAMNMSEVQKVPEEQREAFVMQALELLRDQYTRGFRIQITSDALVEIDGQQEKQDRLDFLTAAGTYIKQAAEAAQAAPQMAPLLMDLLQFGVRGFKVGAEVEGAFDEVAEQMRNQPAPDPRMQQMQQEIEQQQQMMQQEGQRIQQEGQQIEQGKQAFIQERNGFEVEKIRAGSELEKKAADLAVKEIDLRYREQRLQEMSRESVE
jgi:Skp family chaperone for outer membrane proteins